MSTRVKNRTSTSRTTALRTTALGTAATSGSRAGHDAVSPARIAERLAEQRELWQRRVDFDPERRVTIRIAAEPDFEAWLLTWLPGQHTEWHDHGGSAGALLVLQGTLTERVAAYDPIRPPQIVPGARDLGPGSLRSFGRHHVHQVSNDGIDPAISLHVYAPALTEMTHYIPYGDLLDVVEHRLVGVDW